MPQAPKIPLQPEVLRWARVRAGFEDGSKLAAKLKVKPEAIEEWERSGSITMSQVKRLAKQTHTPIGYFYLAEPPEDSLPITDFRTRSGEMPQKPSPNLLETVYQMQRRQAWMREEMMEQAEPALDFVGAYRSTPSPQTVSTAMNRVLGLPEGWAAAKTSWTGALKALRDLIEEAGILVVFNGIVGNNTRRKLSVKEFQGFALVDEFAPLIFINNADFKTAQIFTLAHELTHIFIGETGLSTLENLEPTDHDIERRCNRIAAEFLVPGKELRNQWESTYKINNIYEKFTLLAKHFKVSSIVAARRAWETNLISEDSFFAYYEENKDKAWNGFSLEDSSGGGNFWLNQHWRIGRRFGTAVSCAVMEGRLSYTEAYRLTNLQSDTFARMPKEMGDLP